MRIIDLIEHDFKKEPGSRAAQKRLAQEITTTVHGKEKADLAANVSDIIFGTRSLGMMTQTEKAILLENAPTTEIMPGDTLVDVLVAAGLASSKREARTFIESGAISINGSKITDVASSVDENHFVFGISILRRGKKQVSILRVK